MESYIVRAQPKNVASGETAALYHLLRAFKRRNSTFFTDITDAAGGKLTSTREVLSYAHVHFSDLYRKHPVDLQTCTALTRRIPTRLLPEDTAVLDSQFDKDDIHDAVRAAAERKEAWSLTSRRQRGH